MVGLKIINAMNVFVFFFIKFAKTEPQEPEMADLLQANSSCVNLNLSSWNNGGCPILHFSIEHRPLGKLISPFVIEIPNCFSIFFN